MTTQEKLIFLKEQGIEILKNKVKNCGGVKIEQKLYIVYMSWLAAGLRDMGFKLFKTTANRNKPQFDVY